MSTGGRTENNRMKEKIGIIAGGELDEGFLLPFIEKEAFGYMIAVDGALAGRGKARVLHQLRAADVLAQQLELSVIAHGEEHRNGEFLRSCVEIVLSLL